MPEQNDKIYLGDSVYAEIDCGILKLTTDNGLDISNCIYLEPEVFLRLVKYGASLGLCK